MNNKKFIFAIALSSLFLLISTLLPFTVSAQQVTPTPPNATWVGTFAVRSDLPFVWLRVYPLSSGSVTATAYPNQLLVAGQSPDGRTQVWDGAQWWGYVSVPAVGIAGWVELTSLQAGPTPTPTATTAPEVVASWGISTAVRVRPNIAFLWLRQRPSSDALVLFQVPSGSVLVTLAPPQSDALQNWWPVLDVQSGVMGWAEQNSLQPASIGYDISTATLVPVPTPEAWQPGNKVRVRANVQVSEVRISPNGLAQVSTRVFSGNILDLVGTPQFGDGQWWWLVKTRGTNITGWVAQSALEIAPSDA